MCKNSYHLNLHVERCVRVCSQRARQEPGERPRGRHAAQSPDSPRLLVLSQPAVALLIVGQPRHELPLHANSAPHQFILRVDPPHGQE